MPHIKTQHQQFYVPVVTLSTEDNAKLIQQSKSGLKKKLTGININ